MEIKAFGDHVILEPLDPPEKIGGLHIPESNQEKIRAREVGMVVAVGPKVNAEGERLEDPLQVGDVVVYWKHKSSWLPGLNTKPYIYLHAENIVGRVIRDPYATAEAIKASRERAEKIRQQTFGAGSLVVAAGMPSPGGLVAE